MIDERKYLEKMARQNGGLLMVDDVLNAARDENSILHKHFEWDDSEAAKQYRREQARALIQKCKITVGDNTPVHIRAFVSLPSDRDTGGGYRMVADVMASDTMKDEFIHDIELTIARWVQKVDLLESELGDLIVQLDVQLKRYKTYEHRATA